MQWVSGCGLPIQHAPQRGVDVSIALYWGVDSDLIVFEMALYRYFALGSVPTRVSTLSEKKLEEANTIVHGGC